MNRDAALDAALRPGHNHLDGHLAKLRDLGVLPPELGAGWLGSELLSPEHAGTLTALLEIVIPDLKRISPAAHADVLAECQRYFAAPPPT